MLCLSPNISAGALPPNTIEFSAVDSPNLPYTNELFTLLEIRLLSPAIILFLDSPFTVLFSPIIVVLFVPVSVMFPEPCKLLSIFAKFWFRFWLKVKALQVPDYLSYVYP